MKTFWKEHWIEAAFFVVGVLLIHLFLSASTFWPGRGSHLDSTKASEFGQFIGGYLGTIFVLASVALLIGSFRSQRGTNELTSFESRFFELLKYHRENVSEIGIGDRTGRKIFVSLVREFREALTLVRQCCRELNIDYSQEQQVNLAYMAMYYGVGWNSTRMLRSALEDDHPKELVELVIANMEQIQADYRATLSQLRTARGKILNSLH